MFYASRLRDRQPHEIQTAIGVAADAQRKSLVLTRDDQRRFAMSLDAGAQRQVSGVDDTFVEGLLAEQKFPSVHPSRAHRSQRQRLPFQDRTPPGPVAVGQARRCERVRRGRRCSSTGRALKRRAPPDRRAFRTGDGRPRSCVRPRPDAYPSCRQQRQPERETKRQLLAVTALARRQFFDQRQSIAETPDCLDLGKTALRSPAGVAIPLRSRLKQSGLSEMMRHNLRFDLRPLRQTIADRFGDAPMKLLATALKESRISRVLHERMLESIDRIGRRAAPEQQPGMLELRQGGGERTASSPAISLMSA